jgi:glucose uptake protein GlcU
MGVVVGYVAVAIAVVGFGSNFIPLKSVAIGDGFLFQFFLCCAIFATALPVLIYQNFPQFHGFAVLGGMLWCTGNLFTQAAVKLIGLGLGMLIWGSVGMVLGWASGTFGLFGLSKQEVANNVMNYAAVVVIIIGLVIYLNVESTGRTKYRPLRQEESSMSMLKKTDERSVSASASLNGLNGESELNVRLLRPGSMDADSCVESGPYPPDSLDDQQPIRTSIDSIDMCDEMFNSLSERSRRLLGLALAVVGGVFMGVCFDPSQWIIDNKFGGDDNTLNYVFPHYCGILLTSWCYTIIYGVYMQYYKKTNLYINPHAVVPASFSGIIWGFSQIAWFVANGQLGFRISFPIISSGPGLVAALWGVLVFSEIRGSRNLCTLAAAAAVVCTGLVLIALSR